MNEFSVLLDTQLLLWVSGESHKLPRKAEEIILDASVSLYYSPISLWEVSIKNALNRSDFQVDLELLVKVLGESQYFELAVNREHALGVAHLPPIHKDPFDRMLIAQATVEHFTLLTSDARLGDYPGPIQLV